jgi:hypothetical protein
LPVQFPRSHARKRSSAEGGVDAAILDVNLKGEKSFPIAQDLVARKIPFVFVTGYQSENLPDPFCGCIVISKPVTANIITEQLRILLSETIASRDVA